MAADKFALEGLNKGIQAELAAYVFYNKCIKIVGDDQLKTTLRTLAHEEKEHYRILEGQYDSLVRSEMWVTYNDILKRPGLPDIDEKMEGVHDELIDGVSESSTPRQVFEIALILEERARNLYAELAKKTTDPKGRETYEYLVKFEASHIAKINRLMEGVK